MTSAKSVDVLNVFISGFLSKKTACTHTCQYEKRGRMEQMQLV